MGGRLGIEFRGAPCPITLDLLDWVTTNLLDLREQHPDAELNLIHDKHGITLEARAMRPTMIEQRCSGKKPDEGKGG